MDSVKPVCRTLRSGSKEWLVNGKRHREDGPAFEGFNGTKEWRLNGKRHRLEGPAIEYPYGKKHWYLNGKEYSFEESDKLKNMLWII